MLYMVTFAIHILQMLAYIPYMDPMGIYIYIYTYVYIYIYIFGVSRKQIYIVIYFGVSKNKFSLMTLRNTSSTGIANSTVRSNG